ncbi:PEP-CTERM sorting domain-containing protein [Duganella sp. sic0402]|uniref:PEP-CTERM sorting domain-containing protein n=1 Tax=Duganella sp. sic0402 TaxID=2854786 RepID=UPI001C461053|nr:PEP-CTERM sorting domain-containing protein [Duganella sp. sic0402]MBV7535635.1 PEP-CTERM sorting domain-containing protein [Duganella sp. sic0402]
MKLRILFLVALLLSLMTTPARAQGAWTVTTTGTITEGYDLTGTWAVTNSLAGWAYTLSITANVGADDWQFFDSDPAIHRDALSGFGGAFITTLTINNQTATIYSTSTRGGSQIIGSQVSQAGIGSGIDYISTAQSRGDTGAAIVAAYNSVESSKVAFVPSTDFNQTIAVMDVSSADFDKYASFSMPNAFFYGVPKTLSVTPANYVSAIPEPEIYTMLLAGLCLIGIAARRGFFDQRKRPASRLA